jgi:hypothetical protein
VFPGRRDTSGKDQRIKNGSRERPQWVGSGFWNLGRKRSFGKGSAFALDGVFLFFDDVNCPPRLISEGFFLSEFDDALPDQALVLHVLEEGSHKPGSAR